ncbi:MAG: organic solvent tolerance protein OstA [Selenomonadaceae bacterium]|nr:organic solvent tolerance protein OstA [Selenomonadaceae bacterium]
MDRCKKFLAVLSTAFILTSIAAAEENQDEKPSELLADEVEYNMDTGVATAKGNVSASTEKNKIPSSLNADEVTYDMNSGVITATGNVLLKHGTGKATGAKAMYNVKTMESYLVENVIVTRDDLKITCNSLRNNGQGHMQADGNVIGTQTILPNEKYPNGDTRTFKGEHVDFYPDDKKHVVIPTGGIVTSGDGTFTADHMEGWLDEEHYIGTGNAHAISPPRQMEAGGDRVDYFGKDQGKAILTGNAWAIQENNTIRGNRLTVYLADDKKIKVKPEEQKNSETQTSDKPF